MPCPRGGITLTNFGLGAGPYTNIFLVTNGATGNLKDCLYIPPADGGTQPNISHAFCGLGNASGNSFADTTSFRNTTSGAFTFEALVNIKGNIFSSSAGNGEWEIFCGDNNGSSPLVRGWQFRVQNAATPVLNCNFITASGGSAINFSANLPSSGLDALATNQWYHVAVTYTGNAPTNGDLAGVLTFIGPCWMATGRMRVFWPPLPIQRLARSAARPSCHWREFTQYQRGWQCRIFSRFD